MDNLRLVSLWQHCSSLAVILVALLFSGCETSEQSGRSSTTRSPSQDLVQVNTLEDGSQELSLLMPPSVQGQAVTRYQTMSMVKAFGALGLAGQQLFPDYDRTFFGNGPFGNGLYRFAVNWNNRDLGVNPFGGGASMISRLFQPPTRYSIR